MISKLKKKKRVLTRHTITQHRVGPSLPQFTAVAEPRTTAPLLCRGVTATLHSLLLFIYSGTLFSARYPLASSVSSSRTRFFLHAAVHSQVTRQRSLSLTPSSLNLTGKASALAFIQSPVTQLKRIHSQLHSPLPCSHG